MSKASRPKATGPSHVGVLLPDHQGKNSGATGAVGAA